MRTPVSRLFYHGLLLVLLAVMAASCAKAPRNFAVQNISVEKVRLSGSDLLLRCSADNPNWHALKIKDMNIDVRVDGVKLGQVRNIDKIKLRGRRTTVFDARVNVNHAGLVALLPALLKSDAMEVRIDGKYRVKALFAGKRIEHTEFETVNARQELINIVRNLLKKRKG